METTTGLEAWEETQSCSWLPEFNPAAASRADEQRELMRRLLQRGVTVRTLADAVALSRDALRAHFRKDNIQVPRWPGVAERPRDLTDAQRRVLDSAMSPEFRRAVQANRDRQEAGETRRPLPWDDRMLDVVDRLLHEQGVLPRPLARFLGVPVSTWVFNEGWVPVEADATLSEADRRQLRQAIGDIPLDPWGLRRDRLPRGGAESRGAVQRLLDRGVSPGTLGRAFVAGAGAGSAYLGGHGLRVPRRSLHDDQQNAFEQAMAEALRQA